MISAVAATAAATKNAYITKAGLFYKQRSHTYSHTILRIHMARSRARFMRIRRIHARNLYFYTNTHTFSRGFCCCLCFCFCC